MGFIDLLFGLAIGGAMVGGDQAEKRKNQGGGGGGGGGDEKKTSIEPGLSALFTSASPRSIWYARETIQKALDASKPLIDEWSKPFNKEPIDFIERPGKMFEDARGRVRDLMDPVQAEIKQSISDLWTNYNSATAKYNEDILGMDGMTIPEQFTKARENFDPYVDMGKSSAEILSKLSGAKGGAEQNQAINDQLSSPLLQNTINLGIDKIGRINSAANSLRGGNVLRELQQYGQQTASDYLLAQQDRLANQAQMGLAASGNINDSYANQIALQLQNAQQRMGNTQTQEQLANDRLNLLNSNVGDQAAVESGLYTAQAANYHQGAAMATEAQQNYLAQILNNLMTGAQAKAAAIDAAGQIIYSYNDRWSNTYDKDGNLVSSVNNPELFKTPVSVHQEWLAPEDRQPEAYYDHNTGMVTFSDGRAPMQAWNPQAIKDYSNSVMAGMYQGNQFNPINPNIYDSWNTKQTGYARTNPGTGARATAASELDRHMSDQVTQWEQLLRPGIYDVGNKLGTGGTKGLADQHNLTSASAWKNSPYGNPNLPDGYYYY